MKITIIGAGAFGTALGKILSDNQHEINYYDTKHTDITLEQSIQGAEALVLAIPSTAVEDFLWELPEEGRQIPLILTTKGLLSLNMFNDFADFSVLSGPAFADELMAGSPATLTTTSHRVKDIFQNEQISIEVTEDILGVVLCGSLKNIYAIGAGLLPDFENSLASYIEQSLREMRRYLEEHGALGETVDLACGVGDLVLTATSETSRNFMFGKSLAAGNNAASAQSETVEGLATLDQVDKEDYPLIKEIYERVRRV